MQWIDEKALETWATFLNAREMLMSMLSWDYSAHPMDATFNNLFVDEVLVLKC